MYIGLWLLSARHVSTLLHPHCTPRPSPYIYKRKVQGPRTRGWPRGRTGWRAGSLSPTRTLVTPYCKRIRPGCRTTRVVVPFFVPPCVPSRADPSGLGHAAIIYSSVHGPPGVENADTMERTNVKKSLMKCWMGYLGIRATVIVSMWRAITRCRRLGKTHQVMKYIKK
jgi:hypothetical protein